MSSRLLAWRNTWRRISELARTGGPLGSLSESLRDLRRGDIALRTDVLTRSIAHAPEVDAASAACEGGVIRIHASYRDREPLEIALTPRDTSFAPRGAKEIRFAVSPAHLAVDPRAADIVGAIAAAIAHALWGALLRATDDAVAPGIAESEGDCLRVDLRSVPSVRAFMNRGSAAMALELLELGGLRVEPGRLVLELRLLRHLAR